MQRCTEMENVQATTAVVASRTELVQQATQTRFIFSFSQYANECRGFDSPAVHKQLWCVLFIFKYRLVEKSFSTNICKS